jgi:thiosulfate dehydrogenase
LREGLVDWTTVFGEDGSVAGNPAQGKGLYGAHCTECHGEDGTTLDFKKKEAGVQGVGWLARANPQETLHKIRWGHPGSDMPSALIDGGLTDAQAIDILAYCSSLP